MESDEVIRCLINCQSCRRSSVTDEDAGRSRQFRLPWLALHQTIIPGWDLEDLLGKDGKSELINEMKENISFAYDDFINKVTRGYFCGDADKIDYADLETALVDLNDSLSTG